jgi:hypothetical protein
MIRDEEDMSDIRMQLSSGNPNQYTLLTFVMHCPTIHFSRLITFILLVQATWKDTRGRYRHD